MIVLDTHALIWVLEDAPILGRRAAALANRALAALVHDAKVMTADARLLEAGVVHAIDARR